MDAGRGLYVEGPDFGYSNNGTAIYQRFGCTYLGDGNGMATGNVQNVTGQTGTFTDGLTYDYLYQELPDNFVDWIGPNNGTIYFTSQDSKGRAVCYSGPAGAQRAIHSAAIFGALRNGTNTRDYLMNLYSNYLTQLLGVEEHEGTILSNVKVYPNPAIGSVTFSFLLSHPGHVNIAVFNIAGQKVNQLLDSNLSAGSHQLLWRGDDQAGKKLSSGTYIITIETEKETANKLIVLVD